MHKLRFEKEFAGLFLCVCVLNTYALVWKAYKLTLDQPWIYWSGYGHRISIFSQYGYMSRGGVRMWEILSVIRNVVVRPIILYFLSQLVA